MYMLLIEVVYWSVEALDHPKLISMILFWVTWTSPEPKIMTEFAVLNLESSSNVERNKVTC